VFEQCKRTAEPVDGCRRRWNRLRRRGVAGVLALLGALGAEV
jgi:hypothetical protein